MTEAPATTGRAEPLFALVWTGAALHAASEGLVTVCLTLLVLDLAGPGAALGLVLAVAAVPRALLLPFAGVLADRVHPARLVAWATFGRAAILTVLLAVVLAGTASVPTVAILAGLLGVLDAVSFPAALALLPEVVAASRLERANAWVQGAETAGDLLGPTAAAALVAGTGFGGGFGAVAALACTAAGVFAVLARRLLRTRRRAPTAGSPLHALREGLQFAAHDPVVRVLLVVLAVLNVAVVGPVLVGGAVLAEQRLGDPALVGLVLAGFGAGALAGLLAAGARPPARGGWVLVGGTVTIGVGVALFAWVTSLPAALAAGALVGVAEAYLGVVLVAWLQRHVPDDLRGRVMSLVVLSVVALDPLSYALAGALVTAGLVTLFTVSGGLVLVAAAIAAATPAVRRLGSGTARPREDRGVRGR